MKLNFYEFGIIYLHNILGVCLSCGGGGPPWGKGVKVSMFCIIWIASSRRLQLYDVMDATDRTAQWRARSSRSRLDPGKMEELWWTVNEAN
jgi:hypothetical protein